MLRARAALWAEYTKLHRLVVQVTLKDEVCRRFMAILGVGPVTALAFKSAVDDPHRFRRSRNVGAHFGQDAATLIILLAGGTKKRQQRDIESAQDRWTDYKRRKRET